MLVATTAALTAQNTSPAEDMQRARSILAELVEINTTNSERGDTTLAARALERRLLDAGFPAADVHVLVPDDAATNPGGHSSLPVKKNAIYDLAQALLAVQDYDFPVMLNEVTEAFFAGSADLVGREMGEAMRRIVTDPDDTAAAATLSEDAGYNSRLRATCVATLLEGGHAQNALPQTAQANVNCRILPSHDPADVQARLQAVAEPFDVEVNAHGTATPSPSSPLTPELLDPIERITREMWPGVPVLPVMSTGATDGLYLRREGIPVYGVSGIFGDMDDTRAHGQDERIRMEHFYEGQEFLYRLVKALAGGS